VRRSAECGIPRIPVYHGRTLKWDMPVRSKNVKGDTAVALSIGHFCVSCFPSAKQISEV
jgi:hypothetical protein